jgi:hypothetical protein
LAQETFGALAPEKFEKKHEVSGHDLSRADESAIKIGALAPEEFEHG